MKINSKIKNLSPSEFEKKLPIYIKKYSKKEKQLNNLLKLKKTKASKFTDRWLASDWHELILLRLSHIKNFHKLSKRRQSLLYINSMRKILRYIK
jgi:predicted nucleotidyltransferase